MNSSLVNPVGIPFTTRVLLFSLIWYALGRLIFKFWPRQAFIFFLLCKVRTSRAVFPMIRNPLFGRSLSLKTLSSGWY